MRLLDFELNWTDNPNIQDVLHTPQPPELPDRLTPGQSAQLSELLEYLHRRIRELYASVKIKPEAERVTLEARQWQNLLDLESRATAICERSLTGRRMRKARAIAGRRAPDRTRE